MRSTIKSLKQLEAELEQERLRRAQAEAERDELAALLQAGGARMGAERLLQVLDQAPLGLSYMSHELVYAWVNETQSRFWGIPVSRILGRTVHDVFGPDTEAQIGPLLRAVLDTGRPQIGRDFPFRYQIDGEERWSYWDFTYHPVRGAEGKAVGILVLAQEVSDRVEKERQQRERIASLEATDKLKDQFLSILSHELRTPLNAITGFGSILDDEVVGPLNEIQHRYLAKMLSGSETLLALVDDLLDMSRIEAGKFTLAPRRMRVSEVADGVVTSLLPLAQKRGCTLLNDLPDDLPELLADPQRVNQVLTNLISNAIKFTPEAGRVRVSAQTEGRWLRVEVADTGIGIAEADLPKLFQRFSQLDMGETHRVGGTGLGLSICKALVEAHGGSIGVRSQAGTGSTFWFTLPLDQASV